jgi:hypothetical protein
MPEPFIGEHPHRCIYCKSGWLCQGTKCTLKKKGCWQCMTPAKIKVREELRIAARDRERNAGVTPNIFDHPLGGEQPMYAGIAYSVSEYADYASFSDVELTKAMEKAELIAAQKVMNLWGFKT